ncbi:Rne/Rng family ribonuclease [Paenibacillus senegalensis]|uniref:Rne/Rng family ribonuclease n=1 Tax=Paenibacillus senegalensis TaxID=1465766 RepID=UPI001F161F86|nr:Rne/Rng family ribonuclease [Paenibacillus senegalensis]
MFMQCRSGRHEVAIVEAGHLVEWFTEIPDESQKAGNLYKGRVVNVVPGLQAAFVDIGLEKNAYLYLDDVLPAHLDKQQMAKPPIQSLLREGQTVIVQMKKEATGTKGAKVTTHITLPGRWTVFLPNAGYVAVSRKIEDEEERNRLTAIGEAVRQEEDGLIMRTVAAGMAEDVLKNDFIWLKRVWDDLLGRAAEMKAPSLLYHDLDFLSRVIRDQFTDEVTEWMVEDHSLLDRIRTELSVVAPGLIDRVKAYQGEEPLFQRYGLHAQRETMYRRKQWLPSGGYLIIDPTEALTVIDVNSGKYTVEDDLETTAFLTNMEAAQHIARLIRLRDLGGIILTDFIDMKEESHIQQVENELAKGIYPDRTHTHLVGWTRLQLYEMTRQKTRPSNYGASTELCSCCGRKMGFSG